ncbi:MAG: hypothetical protein SFU87_07750, partial [Chitinophagaceae bacterium]|nr:hypothetical protein [Chitinophagaceae bacterium]
PVVQVIFVIAIDRRYKPIQLHGNPVNEKPYIRPPDYSCANPLQLFYDKIVPKPPMLNHM